MSKYDSNPVGLLHEMLAVQGDVPRFVLVEESGPPHSLTFGYQVPLLPYFLYPTLLSLGCCWWFGGERAGQVHETS